MNWIIDTQLPPRLATFLTDIGHDAIHTTFFPDGHLLQDAEIVAIALQQHRIIITKDSDFWDHYLLKGSPPNVLLLQFGNISNQELLRYFEQYVSVIITHFEQDAQVILFNRQSIVVYENPRFD
jgi:predicted nuclease of predicted toxin-antitoxin system